MRPLPTLERRTRASRPHRRRLAVVVAAGLLATTTAAGASTPGGASGPSAPEATAAALDERTVVTVDPTPNTLARAGSGGTVLVQRTYYPSKQVLQLKSDGTVTASRTLWADEGGGAIQDSAARDGGGILTANSTIYNREFYPGYFNLSVAELARPGAPDRLAVWMTARDTEGYGPPGYFSRVVPDRLGGFWVSFNRYQTVEGTIHLASGATVPYPATSSGGIKAMHISAAGTLAANVSLPYADRGYDKLHPVPSTAGALLVPLNVTGPTTLGTIPVTAGWWLVRIEANGSISAARSIAQPTAVAALPGGGAALLLPDGVEWRRADGTLAQRTPLTRAEASGTIGSESIAATADGGVVMWLRETAGVTVGTGGSAAAVPGSTWPAIALDPDGAARWWANAGVPGDVVVADGEVLLSNASGLRRVGEPAPCAAVDLDATVAPTSVPHTGGEVVLRVDATSTGCDLAAPVVVQVTGTGVAAGAPSPGATWDGATGRWTFPALSTGASASLELTVDVPADVDGATHTYQAAVVGAVPVSTPATATLQQLAAPGTIAGTVLGPDGSPAPGVEVIAVGCCDPLAGRGHATTGPDGTYQTGELPAGTYHVLFVDLQGRYHRRWWGGAFSRPTAAQVVVGTGAPATVDHQLEARKPGAIVADVRGPDGSARADVWVVICDQDGYVTSGRTDAKGRIAVRDLDAGTYTVRAWPLDGTTPPEWWRDSATHAGARRLPVADGPRLIAIQLDA